MNTAKMNHITFVQKTKDQVKKVTGTRQRYVITRTVTVPAV